ncbi:MAG: hypothetical protein ACK4UN_06585 [Limisphaerales bacterium]
MANQFDFISASDKPALILINNPEWVNYTKAVLVELGYKVHAVDTHEEFLQRFIEVQYQVILIDESFGAPLPNATLQALQHMPMSQRRHAVMVLVGSSYETLNSLQAFQQSVHAVINYNEINLLGQLVQKVVSENDLFLRAYRDTAERVAQGRIRAT